MDVGGLLSQLMLVDVAGFFLLLPSEEIKSCRLVSKQVGQVYYEGVVGVEQPERMEQAGNQSKQPFPAMT